MKTLATLFTLSDSVSTQHTESKYHTESKQHVWYMEDTFQPSYIYIKHAKNLRTASSYPCFLYLASLNWCVMEAVISYAIYQTLAQPHRVEWKQKYVH